LSYLLAEGGLSTNSVVFTNTSIENITEFTNEVNNLNLNLAVNEKPSDKGTFLISNEPKTGKNRMRAWLESLGLMGKKSDTKFLPPLYFKLTKEQIFDTLRIF